MRVLVSGGGTAGHVYPALAVAALVEADDADSVAFVGAPDSLEMRLAGEAGIPFFAVKASGWDRARPLTLVTAIATAIASVFRCRALLRSQRADAVIGFGGYVSVPLALAAVTSGVPLVLHEQNSVPGLANRVLSRWAKAVCTTYEQSRAHLARGDRARLTGNPVREQVTHADAAAGRLRHGVGPDDMLLLVFGGSRGARHLNSAIVSLYPRLSAIHGLKVIHIAGPAEADSVRSALAGVAGGESAVWTVLEYANDMGDLLAASDLCVCRAGATTLAELAAVGRPAVLVPYPYATDDHQSHNAVPFVEAGAARVVTDADLDRPVFESTLTELLEDPALRVKMAAAALSLGRPDAAAAVVAVVREAALRRSSSESGRGAR